MNNNTLTIDTSIWITQQAFSDEFNVSRQRLNNWINRGKVEHKYFKEIDTVLIKKDSGTAALKAGRPTGSYAGIEITKEQKEKYLSDPVRNSGYLEISKSIGYSAEAIRRVFVNKPDRVNKVVWEAIAKYVDGKKTHAGPSEAIAGDLGGSKSVAPSNGKTKKKADLKAVAAVPVAAKKDKGKMSVNTDYRTSLRNKKLGLK